MVLVCLPSDALSQHLPSYLGFSYLGRGLSLHGCSSKAQPLLLTLDEGYLLMAATPDLECGVAPLSLPAPAQLLLLGGVVAPLGCCPWPRAWGSLSVLLLLCCSLVLLVATPDLCQMRIQWEAGGLYTKRKISLEATNCVGTLILDFLTPELWEIPVEYNLPHLWYFSYSSHSCCNAGLTKWVNKGSIVSYFLKD